MSAWVVSKGHIDVLVNAMVQHGIIAPTEMKTVGVMLWEENMRSVDARYSEHNERQPYTPAATEATVGAVHIIAAVHCYDYQSCEHYEWDESESFRLVKALLEKVERENPAALLEYQTKGAAYGPDEVGYRWGYESLDQALVAS